MQIRVAISLLLFIQLFSLLSQELAIADEIRKSMWESSKKEFEVTEIPERWKSEDAVIIASSDERSYRKPALSSYLIEENAIHVRVKILSNAGLSDYGQFSFHKSTYIQGLTFTSYVGFKVIKADGKEIIIDNYEAVEEDLKVNTNSKLTTLKLAIPNLEIGDILDYYIVEKYKFPTTKYHSFDPAIFILRKKYPLMYGNIKFAVLRRCYINLKTYNGAPSFEKVNEGDEDIYQLEYRDYEKVEPMPWFYPYRSLPTIKFKVTYASPQAVYLVANFLEKTNPGMLNTSLDHYDISNFLRTYMNNMYSFSGLNGYMKSNFKGVLDKATLAREAFYYERHHLSVKFQENWTIRGNSIIELRRNMMIKNLSNYFKKAKIPYSYIVGVPKKIGNIDQLIVEEEVLLGIQTITNPPVFITSFTTHSLVNELDENFSGAEVLISSNANSNGTLSFQKSKLNQRDNSRNQIFTRSDLNVNLETMTSKIHVQKILSGLTRFEEQRLLMDVYDYIEEEREKYDLKSITADLLRKKVNEIVKLINECKKSRPRELNKKLSEITKDQLGIEIDTVYSFKIIATGRNAETPEFKYNYNIETGDLLKKAGPNYLLSIGKLIERQIEIDKEFKNERIFDIYSNYPRKFKNEISMQIPNGYSVEGIEELNFSVENETGGFISEAKIEKDTLKISVSKFYANSHEPAENWSKMLEFLSVAEDFGESRLLLKRN